MNSYIEKLTGRYRRKGILVDSNLLVLFFVGTIDRALIQRCKRTQSYAIEDFDTLQRYLDLFKRHVTTPNILTEVANLTNVLEGPHKAVFASLFGDSIIEVLREEYVVSADMPRSDAWAKFGLTDAGIISLVRGKYLVLTDDFKLSQYLNSVRADAINFNHIRTINW